MDKVDRRMLTPEEIKKANAELMRVKKFDVITIQGLNSI